MGDWRRKIKAREQSRLTPKPTIYRNVDFSIVVFSHTESMTYSSIFTTGKKDFVAKSEDFFQNRKQTREYFSDSVTRKFVKV